MKICLTYALGLASALLLAPSLLHAQANATAFRTTRIQAGAGLLYLNNDFTQTGDKGVSAWVDYDFSRYVGVEGEVHLGTIISPEDVGENTYLVGPRGSYRKGPFDIYAKLMFGRARIQNDFVGTSSTYNIYAYGGGLDYRVSHHFNIRVIDFEQQKWTAFKPHELSPIAISAGLMYIIR